MQEPWEHMLRQLFPSESNKALRAEIRRLLRMHCDLLAAGQLSRYPAATGRYREKLRRLMTMVQQQEARMFEDLEDKTLAWQECKGRP
jgi:hypothetical protein